MCDIHPQRKRKTCVKCFPDLEVTPIPSEEKQIVPEPNMEVSEGILEAEPVVKKQRKPRVNKTSISIEEVIGLKEDTFGESVPKKKKSDIEKSELHTDALSIKDIISELKAELKSLKADAEDIIKGFKEKMNVVTLSAIAKAEAEKSRILNLKYEYLYIDEGKFSYTMIDKYAREGWKFMAFVDSKLASTYQRDKGFVLFEKVKKC